MQFVIVTLDAVDWDKSKVPPLIVKVVSVPLVVYCTNAVLCCVSVVQVADPLMTNMPLITSAVVTFEAV